MTFNIKLSYFLADKDQPLPEDVHLQCFAPIAKTQRYVKLNN